MHSALSCTVLVITLAAGLDGDFVRAPAASKGTVRFQPLGDQAATPERYRLGAHSFDYQFAPKRVLPTIGVEVFDLRFPSPITSDCPENNTVYAEYYRPEGKGPFAGVIILDITAGNQALSRTIATQLAQNGIAGLFVQMAYYGPRRPPGSRLRLLSPSYERTMDAIRQTVLDLRRAAAWLGARSEIDRHRLGILGTSLGSFMACLTAEMEPRIQRLAVLLGGGGLVDAYWNDARAAPFRTAWTALGGTREQLEALIAPADPLTCAANLRDRRVLMIAARRDEIIPPRAAVALWKAAGSQKIVWYDCTHYGAVLYFAPAMGHIVRHFAEE
jgi:dienelactone hydrolase